MPEEIDRFAVLSIDYTPTEFGLDVLLTTDIPCHLWMRWTTVEPRTHLESFLTRGIVVGTRPYYCVDVYCDNEQIETGDTITHTFQNPRALADFAPPSSLWPWYEPWGITLTENNPWYPWLAPNVPTISIDAGVITLTNPGFVDCGIYCPVDPVRFPISLDLDMPLKIAFDNPDATANSTSSQVLVELRLDSPTESMRMYFAINVGAQWEYLKPWTAGWRGTIPYGWYFVGTGAFVMDILEWFVTFRQYLGLSPDPQGWSLSLVAFALGTNSPACEDYLKNDYIGLYLPDLISCNTRPWPRCQTRWFYFFGTRYGYEMPSDSCIFEKHHGGPTLIINHIPEDIGDVILWSDRYSGTTFVAPYNFKLTSVDVLFRKRPGDQCPFGHGYLKKEPFVGTSLPDNIASDHVLLPELPSSAPFPWITFTFPEIMLYKDTKYSFWCRGCSVFGEWPRLGFRYAASPGPGSTCWQWHYRDDVDPKTCYETVTQSHPHRIWGYPT